MAFWTYYYENTLADPTNPNGGNLNHEIDIEIFGDNTIWYTTWTGENLTTHQEETLDYTVHDNEFHTYRFDWYNGKKVDYYIDGKLVCTIRENIPTKPMKVWIGAWCPSWSGEPTEGDFTMTVKSFNYTAF